MRRSLLILFVVLAAGIVAGSFEYLEREQANARLEARARLESILRLKVEQVAQWRTERLSDAELIRAMPYAARRALDTLIEPSARTRGMFTGFLQPLLASGSYDSALLLDEDLNVRLVHPAASRPILSEALRRGAQQALQTRQVVFTDLHETDAADVMHMDLIVPLVVRREGTKENVPAAGLPPSAADTSKGLLVLQLRPQKFLFPLMQTWPGSSPTAETLLARCEGEEVVFLNELRHRKGTALKLRLPINTPHLPAAEVLRGEPGVQEGLDYRGVAVVTAAQPVPDTGWVMVAKVDQAEVYAPLQAEVLHVAALALALLLAGVLGTMALWSARKEQLLQAQLAAERERSIQSQRFQQLMKQASDAIVVADEQSRILEANESAQVLYGYTLPELRQMPLSQLRAAEHPQAPERPANAPATPERDLFETWHRRHDGTTVPVEISSRSVEIGGERYQFRIIRDITQRKEAEEALQLANARLQQLVDDLGRTQQALAASELTAHQRAEELEKLMDVAPAAIWVAHDRECHKITGNRTANTFYEAGRGENVSAAPAPDSQDTSRRFFRKGRELKPEELPMQEAAARGVEVRNSELEVLSPSGRRFTMLGNASPLRDDTGQVRGCVGTFVDITALKEAEAEVRRLNAELEQRVQRRTEELTLVNRELEAFSYSVSHDLRAPLRHIGGYVSLLEKVAGPALASKGRHYLERVTDSVNQMGRLIDDLLVFSRMGRTQMKQEPIELEQILEESLSAVQPDCDGRNIRWKRSRLPAVQADASMLRQVLINLLSNALKYTRPRDPAEIEIGCAPGAPGEVVVFVRDNGVGFDMQYADKLFGVFQRLHLDEEFEGTGIGLANVRRIIARHGGRTWAEAKLGQGATFYFSLPMASGRPSPLAAPQSTPSQG